MYRRDRHMRTHSRVKPTRDVVQCRLCNKHCDTSSFLTTHLQSHVLIYFCSVCSTFFPSSLRLANHLNVHLSLSPSQPPLSSTDLFWQSIAESVFLPKATSSSGNWLTGIADTACDEESSSLDDVLQDVNCSSVVIFSHSDSEILAGIGNSTLQYDQEDAQCRDAEQSGRDSEHSVRDAEHSGRDAEHSSTSSLDITCIDRNICLKLGYKPMSQEIFKRLRETFGCSECEDCGQLFSIQSDLDMHSNIHTGLSLLPCIVSCI